MSYRDLVIDTGNDAFFVELPWFFGNAWKWCQNFCEFRIQPRQVNIRLTIPIQHRTSVSLVDPRKSRRQVMHTWLPSTAARVPVLVSFTLLFGRVIKYWSSLCRVRHLGLVFAHDIRWQGWDIHKLRPYHWVRTIGALCIGEKICGNAGHFSSLVILLCYFMYNVESCHGYSGLPSVCISRWLHKISLLDLKWSPFAGHLHSDNRYQLWHVRLYLYPMEWVGYLYASHNTTSSVATIVIINTVHGEVFRRKCCNALLHLSFRIELGCLARDE